MQKIKLKFFVILIMTAIISAALGYFAAYTRGLFNMYHLNATTYGHILFLQSGSIVRKVDSSGVNGLIDAIEQNGDQWAAMVRGWQPHSRAKDKKAYSLALEEWEAAQKKLEELRSSRPDN